MHSFVNLLNGNDVGSNELNWDDSQFASPPEEQLVQPIAQDTPRVKGNKKRTKNFNEKEDILLMSAWSEISHDVVQGNEQSCSTYWQ
uniref:Myb-like domain-containing protein n=1 Tax=Arundo donax TaxID=35708 RepID=A0A0A9AQA6_ARUDO